MNIEKVKNVIEKQGFSLVVKNGELTLTRPPTLREVMDLVIAFEGVNVE